MLEKRDRQPEEMTERFCSNSNVDPVRRIKQQVAPQKAEYCVEDERYGCSCREDVKRREALVNQNLVDDELEKDRDDEAQRIEQDRGNGDVPEQSPLKKQFRYEPPEAETPPTIP